MTPRPLTIPASFPKRPSHRAAGEEGYLLLGVIVLVALVLISLAVVAPVIAKQLRRDKEVESEHRAQQYVRAIRLYYRKFNAYPPSIDALKQSNNIRFLRQEYVDPLTGKSDWRIIHLGEQKTTIKVFFGQELGAVGASGGLGPGLGSAASLASSPAGSSAGGGITSPLGAGLAPTQGVGSSAASGATGASGSSGTLGSLGGLASSGSTGGAGGGAIIGVGTARTGPSILTPNKQTTYETWEFWYDPRIEQLYKKGQMNAGMSSGTLNSQSASSFGATGSSGGTGGAGSPGFTMPLGNGSTPAGSSGGFGTNSPTTPVTPSAPGSSTTPQ